MKKAIVIFLIFLVSTISFAQNTIAKLKYEEAEEAFTNNDFELTLKKLKEVETLLKSTNPKILYLQIMSQTRIIEQDLWKDYKIIENTKVSIEKYLKDYEDLPNNEDKYRDIYKISEYFKNAPNSLEDFNDLIKKAEQKKTIEKRAEFERKKNGEKTFMNYVGYQYYEIGITIEDAKIKFPEYFRKTWTDNYKKSEYDTKYMTKNKAIDVIIYSKNGKLVGFERNRLNLGTVQSHVDDFNAKFQFSPSEEKYYQFKIYTWKKNEKKIEIWFNTVTNEIELRQWDGHILIQ